jgi:hypothetical protein
MAKLVIESYGAFLNEAKKKKTKKESFISKSDINKELKSLGFGFVKMQKELSTLVPWARIQLTWKARLRLV